MLKPGGVLVVAALRGDGLWTRWRRLKRRVVASVWRSAAFWSDRGLEDAMRAARFAPRLHRRVVRYLPWPPVAGLLRRWEDPGQRWFSGGGDGAGRAG